MTPKRPRSSTKNEDAVEIYKGPSLLNLPTELILHIASSYPRIEHHSLNLNDYRDKLHDDDDILYFERRDALKALSQTCKTLRNLLLPQLWECFEVAYCPKNLKSYDTVAYLAEKLERFSMGLVENPELASHVRCVPSQLRRNAGLKLNTASFAFQTGPLSSLLWIPLLAPTLFPASALSAISTLFTSLPKVQGGMRSFHPPDFRRSTT